jgi:hypothetical protein
MTCPAATIGWAYIAPSSAIDQLRGVAAGVVAVGRVGDALGSFEGVVVGGDVEGLVLVDVVSAVGGVSAVVGVVRASGVEPEQAARADAAVTAAAMVIRSRRTMGP